MSEQTRSSALSPELVTTRVSAACGTDQLLGELDPRWQARVAVAVVEEQRAERACLPGARPAGDLVVIELGQLGRRMPGSRRSR